MEVQGKLIKVMDVQTFDSGFTKREFVIETSDKYPQKIKLELFKDATNLIDGHKVGDIISV